VVGFDGCEQGLLFLKKKQQKNFCSLRVSATAWPKPAKSKSFLLLFFKKEALASFSAADGLKTFRFGVPRTAPGVAPKMDRFTPLSRGAQ